MPRQRPEPTRYVAFLRAMNVGGHNVKMADLREQFTVLGFTNVTTFIASGNVRFSSRAENTTALEAQIETHLAAHLGFAVDTFIRVPLLTFFAPAMSSQSSQQSALNAARFSGCTPNLVTIFALFHVLMRVPFTPFPAPT